MRSATPADMAGRCGRCFLPCRLCLCARIPRVDTRTHLLIVQHVKERWKSSNTARLAALALPNARLLPYCVPGEPFDPASLAGPDTWLLFPDGPPPPPGAAPPRRLVVLDGSWAQARRMVQRLPGLRGMPRLVLPPPPPDSVRLRKPPHPEGMSTLEAIARALALLEGGTLAEPLERLHTLMVARVLEGKGLPPPD